ncbi:MAG: PstS family phosphate ABC transporter substrate-binding protein [Thermodesulfobacteriota bacterium]
MKSFKVLVLFLAVLGLALGTALAAQQLKMDGSTTVLPIAQKCKEAFEAKHADVNISLSGTGSGDGVKAIIDGTADIGNSSRDLKDKEIKMAEEKGVKIVKHVVALDCIVPVVHPSNPVSDLTMEQLKDIYTGKIKNWKELGGPDKPIAVISRDSSSGTFEYWNEAVLHKEKVRPDAQLQASNGAVAQAVAGNKYALGYVGLGYVNDQLKALTVGGVAAAMATAKDGSYPVSRELYMFTNGEPQGLVKEFLDFIKSAEGQTLAEEAGFVKAY